ncbi:MAG: rhomboid family intramembrane serine protease [Casimicrobiaceae bacterium]
MQIQVPDPAYTGSERARDNFRLAAQLSLGFVALTWLIQVSNWMLDLGPETLGVRPRTWSGLLGILFAPLLHGGFDHLIANSPPLVVLGTAMLYLYPRSSLRVLPAVYLGPGIAVWLVARGSVHVGASGIVYGLATYLFAAGMLRRDRRAIGAGLLVCFMYGALVWGVLPIESGVSWETHLAAAVIGLLLAIVLRRHDIAPQRRYSWEEESAGDVPGDTRESGESGVIEVSGGPGPLDRPADPVVPGDAFGEADRPATVARAVAPDEAAAVAPPRDRSDWR